jgi:hypothetical protein
MDPATKRLAVIAGGLGGMLLLVVGGWSMMGHRSTTVPVVQADSRPVRVKPENPGGMQIAGANEDIFSTGSGTNGGKLAPPPEAPAPQALRTPPPPPAPPVAAPAPVTAAPPVPVKPIVTTPLAAAKPAAVTASAAPKPVAEKATVPPEKPAAAAADKRVVAAPASEHAAGSAAKGALVQLAAVSSEEAAKNEWQRLEKRLPDLLSTRKPAISKTERDGHTLWRLRTGGFSDVAQATVFCERVRAKGTGCSVADF